MISSKDIEANTKNQAIFEMSPPKIGKEIQCLIEWITTLNKFVFKMAKRCSSFFKALKTPF